MRYNKLVGVQKRKEVWPRLLVQARKHHGVRYDYSRVVYLGATNKVEIVCPEHGSFFQLAHSHAKGHGCDKCALLVRGKSKSAFSWPASRERVEKTLRDRDLSIDRSLDVPIKMRTRLKITCSEHGDYEGSLFTLYRGQGCWKCYVDKRAGQNAKESAAKTFTEKAMHKHGGAYDYSGTVYKKSSRKVEIRCSKHGLFLMSPNNHLKGEMCPTCARQVSAAETKIYEFVRSICPDAIARDRKTLRPFEIDILVPSKAIAIEFNGIFWHSVAMNPDRSHLLKKQRAAASAGLRMIHVLESEFEENETLVLRMLAHSLGGHVADRTFARKCVVSQGNPTEYAEFFSTNHHQGPAKRGGVVYALKTNDSGIVAALHMAPTQFYGDPKDRVAGVLEVVRYATSCVVVGGLSRLLSAAIKHADPKRLVSYVDNRWFTGRAYEMTGFKLVNSGTPAMLVFDKTLRRKHRSAITKDRLRSVLGARFDASKTQLELAAMAGYHVLFDCGASKYEYMRK